MAGLKKDPPEMNKAAGCKTWKPGSRSVEPKRFKAKPRLSGPPLLSLCRTDHVKAPVMAFHTIGISALLKLPYRRVAECIRAECHH